MDCIGSHITSVLFKTLSPKLWKKLTRKSNKTLKLFPPKNHRKRGSCIFATLWLLILIKLEL